MGIVLEQRRGGRLYPVGGTLPLPERWRVIKLEHRLRCGSRLSYRATQKALESYAVRRSLGQVFKDVRDYGCPVCSPEQFTRGD